MWKITNDEHDDNMRFVSSFEKKEMCLQILQYARSQFINNEIDQTSGLRQNSCLMAITNDSYRNV